MWATELTALAPRQELGPQDHPLADPLIYTAKCFFFGFANLRTMLLDSCYQYCRVQDRINKAAGVPNCSQGTFREAF
jgi:hypothetical protein